MTHLVADDESDDDAARPGARCAARTVGEVGGDLGQVVVDDATDIVDVDAAGGDIGGDEHGGAPGLEVGERLLALRLAQAAVDGRGVHLALDELLGHAVGAVLGAGEHDGAAAAPGDLGGEVGALRRRGLPEQEGGARVVDRGRLHVDALGGRHVFGHQQSDGIVGGRREQDRLASLPRRFEHATHGRKEPDVDHAIGLVDDEDLDAVEVDVLLGHEIFEAAGRGDEDVDATLQGGALRVHRHAAVDGKHAGAGDVGERVEHGVDLVGQLAGGREHDGRGLVGPPATKVGQHRQPEGERLAGAGGSGGDDVVTFEEVGDGGRLDGRGLGDLGGGEGLHEVFGHAKGRERIGR